MQGIACSVQRTVWPCQGPGAILSRLDCLLEAIVKFALTASLIFALCFTCLAAAPEEKSPKPQYDSKGAGPTRSFSTVASGQMRPPL